MMNLNLEEVALLLGETSHWEAQSIEKIEFDSREVGPGDLFIPLKGERDGHDFIQTAFDRGAIATLSEHKVPYPHFLVSDSLTAFQKLAQAYLEKETPRVVAITGSNGKTTSKDMIAAVLAQKYRTYQTQGNYNNEIGLPYTILHMPTRTEMLVLEMGMDHSGDIEFLSQLARPDMALITLIGESHLEFFGTRAAIAKGKMGITAGLERSHELVIPADPLLNPYIPAGQKLVRFGYEGEDLYITQVQETKNALTFKTNFLEGDIHLPMPGRFNATNAMLAAYVGLKYGVSQKGIKTALSQVSVSGNRTEWRQAANGAEILSDVYNANPTAMKLMLETFQSFPKRVGGKKILVLADMLELGEASPNLHADLSDSIDDQVIDQIYLYGPLMQFLKNKKPMAHHYEELAPLIRDLNQNLGPLDQVLIKGSNAMHLSQVVEALEK